MSSSSSATTKQKQSLDLSGWLGQQVTVKFGGGREVSGILRGHDPLVNLVLDDAVETLRDPADPTKLTSETRALGQLVCRGTAVITISLPGETIENPFANQDGE